MRTVQKMQRSQKKANARRKDYVRRRNINNNVPVLQASKLVEVETFRPARDRKTGQLLPTDKLGHAQVEHVGYKTVFTHPVDRQRIYKNHKKGSVHIPLEDEYEREIGMIAYPKRRNHHTKKLTDTQKKKNKQTIHITK